MEVARTSMIHVAAPHFLWPFAVRYAAHQLNLWPHVSLPKTLPTLRWTGKVGDALVFRFYHPTSRRVLPSQDVTFDESVPFYHLFPYHTAPLPPPPLFLALGPPPVDPLPPQDPAPSGVSQVDPLPGTVPVEGAEFGGSVPVGAEPVGAEPGGSEPEGAEPGGAGSESAKSGGGEPWGAASAGGPAGASPRLSPRPEPLSPQQLREWFYQRTRLRSGAAEAGGSAAGGAGAGGARATILGGAGVPAGAGGTGGARAACPGGVVLEVLELSGLVVLETLALEALELEALALVALELEELEMETLALKALELEELELEALELVALELLTLELDVLALGVQPDSPLPAPSPYPEQSDTFTERREPESRPALRVCAFRTGRRVPRPCPPPVPITHIMALRPSSVPLRVPLQPPPESSLPADPDPECDLDRVASPTVPHLLATVVIDPSFESTAASALVAELVDFAAACRLDYATSLVAEFESDCPLFVGGECALGTDVLEDTQEDFEVKRPPGSPPVFKARYVARGFSQQQGVHFFQTFSPTPKMTTLRVLLHVAAQRDYELHSLDFSTAFLQGSLHKEIWSRRPPGFTGMTLAALGFAPSTADPLLFLRTDTSLPPFYVLVYIDDLVFATADTEALALLKSELQKRHTCTDMGELHSYLGLQITQDRARRTIILAQSHMVHQVLQRFGFRYSSPQSTPLSTSHSLLAPPSHESIELSGPYPELVGCLITSGMGLMLGGRGLVVLTGYADASWVDDLATQRSSQGYTFSLGSGSVSWRSTRSSSVLSSSCEAEIYAGAMAALELCWLTYLLTDLGERPHSSPVLMKHIALRYFLALELQQRCQLCLAYVATRANTADIFTKALQSGDHQRFCTALGLVLTLPQLLTA
ncbi:unnamed protein product [Closterium sp. NIES-53]